MIRDRNIGEIPHPASLPYSSGSAAVSHNNPGNSSLVSARASTHTSSSLAMDWQIEEPDKHALSDKMAALITAKIRAKNVTPVQQAMFSNGSDWQTATGIKNIRKLSSVNMCNMYKRLGKLEPMEKSFLDRFFEKEFQLTHATNQNVMDENGTVTLFSRKKLMQRGIQFPQSNTQEADLRRLASDDHVFFALEASGENQKHASRFGKRMYRFSFERPDINQQGLMHLFDPITKQFPSAPKWLKGFEQLSENEQRKVMENLNAHVATMNTLNSLFHGGHIKPALALSVIERCRYLPDRLRQTLLNNNDINSLINGLYRPQILVPRHFYARPTSVTESHESGDVYNAASALETLFKHIDHSFQPSVQPDIASAHQHTLYTDAINSINQIFDTHYALSDPFMAVQHADPSASIDPAAIPDAAAINAMSTEEFEAMLNLSLPPVNNTHSDAIDSINQIFSTHSAFSDPFRAVQHADPSTSIDPAAIPDAAAINAMSMEEFEAMLNSSLPPVNNTHSDTINSINQIFGTHYALSDPFMAVQHTDPSTSIAPVAIPDVAAINAMSTEEFEAMLNSSLPSVNNTHPDAMMIDPMPADSHHSLEQELMMSFEHSLKQMESYDNALFLPEAPQYDFANMSPKAFEKMLDEMIGNKTSAEITAMLQPYLSAAASVEAENTPNLHDALPHQNPGQQVETSKQNVEQAMSLLTSIFSPQPDQDSEALNAFSPVTFNAEPLNNAAFWLHASANNRQ